MPSRTLIFNPGEGTKSPPSPALIPTSSSSFSGSTSALSLPCTEITFYANADLILEVFNEKKEMLHLRVASTALCIASPVFRAMLSPDRFLEGNILSSCSRKGTKFTLTLPEDDPESLIILCNILHFNNYNVPRAISVNSLARLCVLLDKYVCTLAAASWIDYWFGHMPVPKAPSTPEPDGEDRILIEAMWLFISVVTGDSQRFSHFSALQMMSLRALDVMDSQHREWFNRLPSKIQDALMTGSQEAILATSQTLQDFCTGKQTRCQLSLAECSRGAHGGPVVTPKDCDAHFIGILLQSMQIEMLAPEFSAFNILTDPGSWQGSVNELLDRLEGIAQGLANTRLFVPPHMHCQQGRALCRKLRELRHSLGRNGLVLAEFRGGFDVKKLLRKSQQV
ncbi:hypothetical protein BDZ91DRAFT_800255 [Kalaharituber pfeilii]|nr:hypothetical protein BDZ91DRAFT_800255 [Kalaharituber pfeilii]